MAADDDEPLLRSEQKRYTLEPIRHDDVWRFYERAEAGFWVAGEVDLAGDLVHWRERLTADERHFVSHVLAFFAASDGIVNENLAERFGREVQMLEAKYVYDFQKAMENIHSQMYSRLISTYIDDAAEADRLFRAVETVPCVGRKAAWALKWIESSASFATRLVAFAVVEGIFFSGSFCAIFWLKKRGLMPGLCQSNELIARDEGLHQDFACHLYVHHVRGRLDEATVHALVGEAVAEEVHFCTEALPVALLGMNAGDMATYIRFVADRLLRQLGHAPLYRAANPFDWMDLQSLQGKTNFFERRVSEYRKAGTAGARGDFVTDAAF
jgi:ribonucleoside-diphosphate reductase beta chain